MNGLKLFSKFKALFRFQYSLRICICNSILSTYSHQGSPPYRRLGGAVVVCVHRAPPRRAPDETAPPATSGTQAVGPGSVAGREKINLVVNNKRSAWVKLV